MRRSLRTIDSESALHNYLTGIGILKMRSEGVELEEAAKKNGVSLAYAWSLSTIAQHFPKEVFMRLGIGKCETIYKCKVPGNHLPVIYRIAGMCSMQELRRTLIALYGEPNGRERVAVLQCTCSERNPVPYGNLHQMRCERCLRRRLSSRNGYITNRAKVNGLCVCGRTRKLGCVTCRACYHARLECLINARIAEKSHQFATSSVESTSQ